MTYSPNIKIWLEFPDKDLRLSSVFGDAGTIYETKAILHLAIDGEDDPKEVTLKSIMWEDKNPWVK